MIDSLDWFRKLYIVFAPVAFLIFAAATYIEGSRLVSAIMAVSALFSVVLSYRYYRELKSEGSIEDERFLKINRKSAIPAFFATVMSAVIYGGLAAVLRTGHSTYAEWVIVYDTVLVAATGGVSFLLAQMYYVHFGTETSFWKLLGGK